MASLLDFQVTFLLVASAGVTVAVSVSPPPGTIEMEVWLSVTPVTGTVASVQPPVTLGAARVMLLFGLNALFAKVLV